MSGISFYVRLISEDITYTIVNNIVEIYVKYQNDSYDKGTMATL